MITSFEVAQSIMSKYYDLNKKTDTCFGICEDVPIDVCDKTGRGCGLWKEHAKQCGLIYAQGMIDKWTDLALGLCTCDNPKKFEQEIDFWQNVVKSLERL